MKIVTLFGIDIRLNFWLLLFFVIAFWAGIIWDVAILFAAVFLHEMAHAFVSRLFHAPVESVELFPFGGVARVVRSFELYPKAEILIALAGPFFNFMLALLTAAYFYFTQSADAVGGYFLKCNLLLGAFNFMPALPLDGGRILRALLSQQIGLQRATKFTLILGHLLALGVLAYGIYLLVFEYLVHITVLCTPVFLWLTIVAEGKNRHYTLMQQWTKREENFKKAGNYAVHHMALPCHLSLASAASHFLPRRYHMVTLLDEQMQVCGTLSEQEIMQGWMKMGGHTPLYKLVR